MRIIILFIMTGMFAVASYATQFGMRSNGLTHLGRIPADYTCVGRNISPQLSWQNPPRNVAAYALIFSCPDCVSGTNYLWVIFNIPSDTHELSEGANSDLPEGVLAANNSFGDTIYRGPCAPDNLTHHYVYTLYALDSKLDLSAEADLEEVLPKIKHHTIDKAELMGVFD